MPYIDPADRGGLTPASALYADDPGALNFQITTLIDDYLHGNLNYRAINDVIGVLECAKLEVYRRVASPYEDQKCALNGDVYKTQVKPFGRLT